MSTDLLGVLESYRGEIFLVGVGSLGVGVMVWAYRRLTGFYREMSR